MKYQYEHEIDVPFEEKTFILPEDRQALFTNLIENYKVFCPEMKLVYAFLNYNSEQPVDYLLIFSAFSHGVKVCLWDVPFLYSNKTIPAYRYICRNNLYTQFFTFCRESLCRMSWDKFKDFIPSRFCNLSWDKDNIHYWKNPENSKALVQGMMDLSLQYTPKPGQCGVKVIPSKADMDKYNATAGETGKK